MTGQARSLAAVFVTRRAGQRRNAWEAFPRYFVQRRSRYARGGLCQARCARL